MGGSTEAVTEVLEAVGAGDAKAAEKLLPLGYIVGLTFEEATSICASCSGFSFGTLEYASKS
jgi:hypothetical protein